MTSGIYKISSLLFPERIYIGSAINLKHRRQAHQRELRKNKHHNIRLQNHYNKYGADDLQFETLELCYAHLIEEREQFYIDTLNPYFNIARKAYSGQGVFPSDEARAKRRASFYVALAKQTPEEKEAQRARQKIAALARSPVPAEVNGFRLLEANHLIQDGHRLSLWKCMLCGNIIVKGANDLKTAKAPCSCRVAMIIPQPKPPKKIKPRTYGKRVDNSTGYSGVTFEIRAGKYRARVRHNSKNVCVPGYYDTALDAMNARNQYLVAHSITDRTA